MIMIMNGYIRHENVTGETVRHGSWNHGRPGRRAVMACGVQCRVYEYGRHGGHGP